MKVTNNNTKVEKDPKKEKVIQILTQVLSDGGYKVRREELGRGFGWKASSGTCRVLHDKVLFLDRRLPQSEQLSLLLETTKELMVVVSEESKTVLQEHGVLI